MKKWWFGERKYRDDDSRRRAKIDAKADIRSLKERGTREEVRDYLVAMVRKNQNREASEAEIDTLMELFEKSFGKRDS